MIIVIAGKLLLNKSGQLKGKLNLCNQINFDVVVNCL